ncbi:hypothetical protein L2E82_11270 [Cichorium intybus]|uniref:Uncharacterized protein n=1 Tax=Cichorium intybus TaxID=13427 RepID=A0ACB9GDU2_CICIN|nr:hypothetical protein L2E82_11270 [Cichorium intybus]
MPSVTLTNRRIPRSRLHHSSSPILHHLRHPSLLAAIKNTAPVHTDLSSSFENPKSRTNHICRHQLPHHHNNHRTHIREQLVSCRLSPPPLLTIGIFIIFELYNTIVVTETGSGFELHQHHWCLWLRNTRHLCWAGTFDLVGMIVYEVDQLPYQNTFYNGTIEVVEAGGLVSVETLFLISLGIGLFILCVLWVRGQMQNLSKLLPDQSVNGADKVFKWKWFRHLPSTTHLHLCHHKTHKVPSTCTLQAFDSLLQKLHTYVPLGASGTDLYAGAGVIGLSVASTGKCRKELFIFWSDVLVVDPLRKGLDPSLINLLALYNNVMLQSSRSGSSQVYSQQQVVAIFVIGSVELQSLVKKDILLPSDPFGINKAERFVLGSNPKTTTPQTKYLKNHA